MMTKLIPMTEALAGAGHDAALLAAEAFQSIQPATDSDDMALARELAARALQQARLAAHYAEELVAKLAEGA